MRRWNVNLHHHRVILDAVPDGAEAALDVGCGEGMLTRQLVTVVPQVLGLDLDRPSLELARCTPAPGVTYGDGDVLTADLEPESFDLVASVAMLHHLDTAAGLARMRDLVRPGGTLALIGIARPRLPQELPSSIIGRTAKGWHQLRGTYWEHSAPMVWPPADTFPEIRALAEGLLPGVRCRWHLLGRYSLVWTKPFRPS